MKHSLVGTHDPSPRAPRGSIRAFHRPRGIHSARRPPPSHPAGRGGGPCRGAVPAVCTSTARRPLNTPTGSVRDVSGGSCARSERPPAPSCSMWLALLLGLLLSRAGNEQHGAVSGRAWRGRASRRAARSCVRPRRPVPSSCCRPAENARGATLRHPSVPRPGGWVVRSSGCVPDSGLPSTARQRLRCEGTVFQSRKGALLL